MSPRKVRAAFVLELEAIDDPLTRTQGARLERQPAYRLRLALKVLLRRFGLRCVSVRPSLGQEGEGDDGVPAE